MRSFLCKFLLIILVIPSLSCDQNTESSENSKTKPNEKGDVNKLPKTKIEYDSIFYAGDVIQGKDIIATFNCKNIGNQPWEIAEIRPSCGCTNATKAPKKAIAVGDSFEIRATIATENISSKKIDKTVTVLSNCQESALVLRVIGKLIK